MLYLVFSGKVRSVTAVVRTCIYLHRYVSTLPYDTSSHSKGFPRKRNMYLYTLQVNYLNFKSTFPTYTSKYYFQVT